MNKIEQAIILAAGKGERMRPLTNTLPKPLIKVNGERMIESIIKALQINGIKKIYIVTGYLNEKFDFLTQEYNDIHLIKNPYYKTSNNISSLYVARDHLENSIILDGDQIIYNPDILTPFFDNSGYSSKWTSKPTNEWLQTVQNNKVIGCSRTGGKNGWQLYSISRWTKEDGKKLKKLLEIEFEKNKNTQIYWDDLAMFCYPDQFDLTIYPIHDKDIVEIDNYEELLKIDSSYSK